MSSAGSRTNCPPLRRILPAPSRRSSFRSAVLLAAALLAPSGAARAEFFASGYLGVAAIGETDVDLTQPGGTDLRFHDLSFDDESLRSPIYYGWRFGYRFRERGDWGIELEYVHAKAFLREDDLVRVEGTRGGAPVSGLERAGDTLQGFSLSHGLNLFTVNGAYRWRAAAPGSASPPRLCPYAGAGVGVAVPHVEVTLGEERTSEYQAGGPAWQVFGGLDIRLGESLSTFVELKLSRADLDDLEAGGGTIRMEPTLRHLIIGASWSF